MILLWAERSDVHALRFIGESVSLADLKAEVLHMDLKGTWPVAYDAIAQDLSTGENWMLTDDWEKLEKWKPEPLEVVHVVCPDCLAMRGETCRTATGNRLSAGNSHAARFGNLALAREFS